MENNGKKAVVALSGGVDSSVAALLLKKQGYEVIGLTGKMTDSESSDSVIKNARNVAEALGVEHYVYDSSKLFREKVIDYFEARGKVYHVDSSGSSDETFSEIEKIIGGYND